MNREQEKLFKLADELDAQDVYELTEEMLKYREGNKGIKNHRLMKIASILVAIIVGMGVLSLEPVQAAIAKIFYYLPGFGEVTTSKEERYYILPEAIVIEEDLYITTIKKVIKRGEELRLSFDVISKDNRPLPSTFKDLEVDIQMKVANTGQVLNSNTSTSVHVDDGKLFEWHENFVKVPEETAFILEIEGMEYTIQLMEVNTEQYNSDKWQSVQDEGYKVTIIPLNNNKDEFATLVERMEGHEEEGENIDIIGYTARVEDELGNEYELENLYSSTLISEEYKVQGTLKGKVKSICITEVSDYKDYQGKPIRLPNPKPGERVDVNKKMNLEGIPFIITHVENKEGLISIGWQADTKEEKRINQVDFEVKNGISEGSAVFDGGVHEERIKLDNPEAKFIEVNISRYGMIQKGDWTITY